MPCHRQAGRLVRGAAQHGAPPVVAASPVRCRIVADSTKNKSRRSLTSAGNPGPCATSSVPSSARTRDEASRVLLHQRADHSGFVERRRGARRRVRRQQQPLVLRDRARTLEHHRHQRASTLPPLRQALESVHDLVGLSVVRAVRYPKRKRGAQLRVRTQRRRTKRRVARTQLLCRYESNSCFGYGSHLTWGVTPPRIFAHGPAL